MCSTCLILVTVSVISWRKPSDSSQKSLSCKTDVFIGKDCEKSLNIDMRHINWSTLKAISAFITKNVFNVVFF